MNTARIVCFGEIMLRLTPPGPELPLQSPHFRASVGGAEANVAVSLAQLGHQAAMVSVLADNVLGHAAAAELRRHGVDIDGIIFTPGRLGLYFVTQAASVRPAEVLYDRLHSTFAEAAPDLIDWSTALSDARFLHLSGVTPALGPRGAAATLRAASEAARLGVPVSFDGNYRSKLWAQWNGDAASILKSILGFAEVAFIDDRDISLILDCRFDESDPFERRRKAATRAFEAFPRLDRIAATSRSQGATAGDCLSATLFTRRGETELPPMALGAVVDRIGSGDAFAAGLLHGLITGLGERAQLEFALSAAALKHAIPGDFNLSTVGDVEALMRHGSSGVRR